MTCNLSVNRFGLDELEERGFGFELGSISTLHSESTGHRTEGGRQRTARCIFEELPGLEDRLFADDARSVDLLRMTGSVHDRPVSVHQLDGRIAYIRNPDRVEKKPVAGWRVAVFRRKTRTDLDANACGFGFGARLREVSFGHAPDISRQVLFDGSPLRR